MCTEVGSSVETECPHARTGGEDWQLHEVYAKPLAIREYEGGLWLNATHMPLLDACYMESDTGYRPCGSVGDFWRLAESMGSRDSCRVSQRGLCACNAEGRGDATDGIETRAAVPSLFPLQCGCHGARGGTASVRLPGSDMAPR